MTDYYNKEGYERYIKKVRQFYLDMSGGRTPLAMKEHISPSRMPAIELPDPKNMDVELAQGINISIVMASFNSAFALERVFESINRQNFPKENIEAIVIDDASTNNYKAYFSHDECRYKSAEGDWEDSFDQTAQTYISERLLDSEDPYKDELDRLSEVYPELNVTYLQLAEHKTWNRAGAINTASKIARGDILIFLRGDTLLIPEDFCLFTYRQHYTNNFLYLHAITPELKYTVDKGEQIDWGSHPDPPMDRWPEWPGSSIRKQNWLEVKGYNEKHIGWGGLEEVYGRLAEIGVMQAIEPRLVAHGFYGMMRFTTVEEHEAMMESVRNQSEEARRCLLQNDEDWGNVPISVRRDYNC